MNAPLTLNMGIGVLEDKGRPRICIADKLLLQCARGRGPSVNRMPTFAEGEPSTQMAGTPRHALHMNNQSPRQYYDAFHGSTILSTPLGTGQVLATTILAIIAFDRKARPLSVCPRKTGCILSTI